jgi:hypothetical protein
MSVGQNTTICWNVSANLALSFHRVNIGEGYQKIGPYPMLIPILGA